MSPADLDEFKTISRRVSLNIPQNCPWRWDKEFNLALTVIDSKDEIMVELPLALEFANKWDFSTIYEAEAPLRDFFQAGFGIIPGQKVFTTDPIDGIVLYVAWWPWGDEERISLRLGLMSISGNKLDHTEMKKRVCHWLGLEQ
ncbi:hypothetical protein [Desulfosarcina ovata]|uniref:Uncharacterized protein n=2 Tax=Desulfosarcina ovata TaxID=83564 RepID=A0A5K8A4W3_9BACT|nr:hypothetical protein [Desulfosarcina ovata]BBO80016.1 hypothetical protein DSCO28_05820 [Desulfosarcina ovata subsp. sediminis]BBO87330.1 hypothetical protein DSCOOX_05100 [Desulfosarcina ovata subsp. ovata]